MITELKPTNLIAVEVAVNTSNYSITKVGNYFHITYDVPSPVGFKGSGGFALFYNDFKGKKKYPNELKLLGPVTKDKIGFDVEPYLERLNDGSYADYEYGGNILKIRTLNRWESFYSLLAANGRYFENPMKEPKDEDYPFYHNYLCAKERWQSFEDKLVKGKLLIIEKI
jgi:hypothetical protein